jgi:hypothetical protein
MKLRIKKKLKKQLFGCQKNRFADVKSVFVGFSE